MAGIIPGAQKGWIFRSARGWLAFSVCLLSFMIGATGCQDKQSNAPNRQRSVNVRTWTVEKRPLRPYLEAIGSLKPYDLVVVSTELDGILKSVKVEEGSAVNRGSIIAEIKDTDYRLAVEQAKALLRQAEASLANTEREFERKEALYREELVTKQQYDDVSARLAFARAELERARAGLDLAREKLAKTTIVAPLSGAVSEKKAAEGDYVRNGTPLVTIIRTDLLKLHFTVSEKDVGPLRLGQEVGFTVDAFSGHEFKGRVQAIHPALDERSRSLQVQAVVSNAEGRLRPGHFARVTLYLGPPQERVMTPITSLLYDNSNVKVFVVEDGRAKERRVKVGKKYGEFMEVTDGLREGEQVVTVGQNNLMEGVIVNVAR